MIDFTRYPNNKLPLPLLKNHSLKRKSMRTETKMESGYPRSRNRFKGPPAEMNATFSFSSDDLELFEGWYHHVINNGADWFVMPVKTGGVVADHQCKFVGDYSQKPISQSRWTVTGKLLVKNLRVISEDETIGRITGYESATQAAHDAIDESVTNYVLSGEE
jgi:hypothetical protein